ncbi:hypothetical protein BGW36DRAFT_158499 [Talaromyces proteolyticus]|uniref:Uncharacterized protein n=1 Tax=Talaromyces proteolyticus TaxID=1131652 RepID=A0AAD4KU39_9EURO|nr:uncharacterized protein BGW36DRAFT_158499 [Talaromyces proteolyticus]KAH8699287.1 hypothetical protein BGW36DRAFT_158499 [Talaromyces proteolyticus]
MVSFQPMAQERVPYGAPAAGTRRPFRGTGPPTKAPAKSASGMYRQVPSPPPTSDRVHARPGLFLSALADDFARVRLLILCVDIINLEIALHVFRLPAVRIIMMFITDHGLPIAPWELFDQHGHD